MSLVFAGICSHAPGITGRASMADPALREPFYAAYRRLGERLIAARPHARAVWAPEHFPTFFLTNIPGFPFAMARRYNAPTRGPGWPGTPRAPVRGNAP